MLVLHIYMPPNDTVTFVTTSKPCNITMPPTTHPCALIPRLTHKCQPVPQLTISAIRLVSPHPSHATLGHITIILSPANNDMLAPFPTKLNAAIYVLTHRNGHQNKVTILMLGAFSEVFSWVIFKYRYQSPVLFHDVTSGWV